MRHVVIHKPGGYGRLEIEDAPDLHAGPGQVRVAVEAIGINYADCIIRMGLYSSAKEFVGWPITPGFESAGKVIEVGEGVAGVDVGQDVIAVSLFGGYAEQVVVDASSVRPRPAGWSAAQAAGFPTVFLTAWYAMVHCAATQPGHTVLIHSAAGGVGGSLLQMAKILGARAIGVVGGAHKVESARALGAAEVIDKSSEDLWSAAERHAPDGYHAVFDANGVSTLWESYEHMRPTGRLIVYGHHSMLPRGKGVVNWLALAWHWWRLPKFDPLRMTESNKSVMAFNLSYLFEERPTFERAIDQIMAWIEDGRIAPPPVTTFPMDRVADAHRALETGTTVGKLVLIP